ncbi:hypothetical protein AVM11_16465 [Sphingomonas melonis TY]|jgi:hypothetical protein|uniref:Uncharacterized protein n=1 Tax=Sphingomonas melonis TY TaxID=621456 RepID=A0A175Y726_9SPHN|nr:hypothetical protein [Sphingomonas melonis]AOW25294.1 hypothetical protein BJP26_18550 [Sphingomonas melonis TY]KZB95790.1 hypothetical protein AVM11_16465 [Sphingomonas melonis TY]
MMGALPAQAHWHREWCIHALSDREWVESAEIATEAVLRLEDELGWLIHGNPNRAPQDEADGLHG